MDFDAGLARFLAQIGAGGDFDLFFLVDEGDFRHRESPWQSHRWSFEYQHCMNPICIWHRGAPMIRLAHFSDIHVSTSPLGWQLNDWFSKRLTSWLNHRAFG